MDHDEARALRAEERLLGWLVIFRAQLAFQASLGLQAPFMLPAGVREAMLARKWIELTQVGQAANGAVAYQMDLTDRGMMVSDLAGPEWGVSLMGAPSGTSREEPET